jgi:hypothetical protein
MGSTTISWRAGSRLQADILFMIDNGSSMAIPQANLEANLPAFLDVLKSLAGGLPDLHIAVVTSDMGAGDGSSILGCSVNGDDGVFRFQATGTCASVGFTDPNATFIVDSGGANPVTNFGIQDIDSVLQCIVEVGSNGCGFQHQLGAVARALGADGASPPPQNAGFLRPDALLAIVLVTREDDCSGPPNDPLFEPTSSQLNSMFGPTQNFQCNEWGHLCVPPGGGPPAQPSRFAPNNLTTDQVIYTPPMAATSNCQSFENSPVLSPVGALADGIKSLKADPDNTILVTGLVGLNEGPTSNGYMVGWQTAPTPDTGPWPKIAHACGTEAAGAPQGFADPAVRIEQFVREFGNNGLLDSFCQANYSTTLATIATKLAEMGGPPCLHGLVANKPNSLTPDCAVSASTPDPAHPGQFVQSFVPPCDTANPVGLCWELSPPIAGGAACNGLNVVIVDGATPLDPQTTLTATCSVCVPNQPDPARGCP